MPRTLRPAVRDNLVLFDGDWLLGGAPFWDELLREDGRVLSAAGHQVLDDAILRRR